MTTSMPVRKTVSMPTAHSKMSSNEHVATDDESVARRPGINAKRKFTADHRKASSVCQRGVPVLGQFRVEAIGDFLALEEDPNVMYDTHIRPLLNRHFAVITGCKTSIAEIVYRSGDGEKDRVIVRNVSEFKYAFQNLVHVPTGWSFVTMWLQDPSRRTYLKTVYEIDPSKVHKDHLNTFFGFGFERVFSPAEILNTPDLSTLRQDLAVIFEHVERVLCNGDKTCAEYVHKYLAHLLQRRGVKTEVALVFTSRPGVGKGVFVDRFVGRGIFGGESYTQVNDVQKILGRFNACGSGHVLVNLDEVTERGAAFSLSDRLKSLITEPRVVVERKGKDPESISHFANYVITTNHANPVKVEPGDRRFCVVECSEPPDETYFDRLLHAVDDPKTLVRYIQYLMSLDLANFQPQRDRPITSAYRRMMSDSKPTVAEFVCWLLDRKLLTGEEEKTVLNTHVYEWYMDWRRTDGPSCAAVSSRTLMLDLNNHQLTTSGRAGGNKACRVFRADLKDVLIHWGWYDV
jgi:hypothetical protein